MPKYAVIIMKMMSNMKYAATVSLVILNSIHIACESFDKKPFNEREEAAVYRAYIDNYYTNIHYPDRQFDNRPFSSIMIFDKTSGFIHSFRDQQLIAKMSPRPEKRTIQGFLGRNDGNYPKSQLTEKNLRVIGRHPINPYLKFKLSHILITDAEIDQIFRNGGWEEFYRLYPNSRGLVSFSRVGFNRNETQALLYFEHWYGEDAGEGYLVLLKKTQGEWKQIAQTNVWTS
jgi:hypothetical protein